MRVTATEVLKTEQKTSKAGKTYFVTTFKGSDGKLYENIYGKIAEGQELQGEWKDTEWGLKFEVTKPEGGFRPGGMSPEREKSIIRQHSQDMALKFIGYVDFSKKSEKEILELVFKLADKFDEDVLRINKEKPVQGESDGKVASNLPPQAEEDQALLDNIPF